MSSQIGENLEIIRERIAWACQRSGRSPGDVSLIAVSKTFPADAIGDAVTAGQRIFGESKLQEAMPKIESLPDDLEWHFIGRIQRNKVRKLLTAFPVLHAIDSLRLAGYADEISAQLGVRPRVFLQINSGGEASKGGFSEEEILRDFEAVAALAHMEVLGLMTIPPETEDAGETRRWFSRLRELRDRLQSRHGRPLPALSMGMSADFEIAIEEGATHVRVGSSIFGRRAYRVDGELG